MDAARVTLQFDPNYVGTMTSPTGTVLLGDRPNGVQPYHLLFGALASCFYATFLGVANKKRLTFERVELTVDGHKRDDVPPTLDYVKITFVIHKPSNEEQLKKSAELGAKYCSIHETISKVATMELDVQFVG